MEDRTVNVKQMARIYEQAYCVIIWTGELLTRVPNTNRSLPTAESASSHESGTKIEDRLEDRKFSSFCFWTCSKLD